MATPNAQRLALLTELRQAARLTLSDMAQRCGLRGRQSHQTAGAWELGNMTPTARRRVHFLGYLWDDLGLRHDPARFEEIWELLCEEWDWEPIGDQEWHQLTSQPRPATRAHQPVQAPVPTSPITPAVPFQAPPVTAHFVGRAETMQQALPLLTAPTPPRTAALVGMGGIGKTTLAIHFAHALQSHFVDGVLWAQTAISTPLDILQSWARAFGYDYSELHDVESCAAALRSALATRQILFVLDNVESVQRVKPLLIGGEGSAVLLTTRSEDAAVALGSQVIPLVELSSDESTQLLTKLLGAERVARETAAAAQIGELLHHLPLAVEIVGQLLAARSRRPLAQMAQRLQDVGYRLDLQISDRDVRTSFLVSWEALDGAQQRLFAHLAVFAGRSFTVEALAVLLGEHADTVLDQLDLLVARSLVKEVESDRYSQHPLLADFAREQLGDAPDVWARFAESQLAFAREHQTDYAALEPEWDNVMAGMAVAQGLERWETVVDYAEVLGTAWVARARYLEARQGYGWAVEAGEKIQNFPIKAKYLNKLGYILAEQSEYKAAWTRLTAAYQWGQQLQDEALIAEAAYHLARVALETGEYETVDEFLLTCEQLTEKIEDKAKIAAVYHLRALLFHRLKQYEASNALCHQARTIQEQQNDFRGHAVTLRLLADNALMERQQDLAVEYCESALQLAHAHNLRSELAEAHFTLATVHRRMAQFDRALLYAQEAKNTFTQIGNRAFEAYALYEMSLAHKLLSNYEASLRIGEQGRQTLKELGDEYNLVFCLYHLGDLHTLSNNPPIACQCWREALALAQKLHHPLIDKINKNLQICY